MLFPLDCASISFQNQDKKVSAGKKQSKPSTPSEEAVSLPCRELQFMFIPHYKDNFKETGPNPELLEYSAECPCKWYNFH